MKKSILIGNRIPRDFFVTNGIGESDIAIHAGSYHLALKNAGIETQNIMTYSSILPKIANQIEKPKNMIHGAVMESIIASCNSEKGHIATAGIIYAWLYDKETNEKYGGLVCENKGEVRKEELETTLRSSLEELYTNGFSDKYYLKDITIMLESFIPQKKYGTALVAICFNSYLFPILD